jgi:hypothetical protein
VATDVNPAVQANFEPGLFGPIEIPSPRKGQPKKKLTTARGSRPVLSWRDFVLPELVRYEDNGDPSVEFLSSFDQAEQAGHLLDAAQDLTTLADEQKERKRYVQSLKKNADSDDELTRFLAGDLEAEENFRLWLLRKVDRKKAALQRKANRLACCAVIARPMDCLDCGLKGFIRFYCGNRYCRYCGDQVFRRLFAKYIRLQAIVEQLMCRNGFRPTVVLATFTFTTGNLGRMPTAEEIRKFNEDVRTTLRLACKQLKIKASAFGALWCDEFGGWNNKLQDYNTNLHCHGLWLGPFLPSKLVSAIWTTVRGNGDYRVVVEPVPFYHGRPDYSRALGHALKYTSKHVSRYSTERLAELELAFNGVRRVHTMGLFYNAKECKEEPVESGTPACPRCNGRLAYPRNAGLQRVKDLEKEGRKDLEALRKQMKLQPDSRGSPAAKLPSSSAGDVYRLLLRA